MVLSGVGTAASEQDLPNWWELLGETTDSVGSTWCAGLLVGL
jgi:hypothetical protein